MGPTLFVQLPQEITEEVREELGHWIFSHTLSPQRQGNDWKFHLAKEGCLSSLAIVPFGAEANGDGTATDVYFSPSEMQEYEQLLGWLPRTSLQLDNFCRSDKNGHRLLLQMAGELATIHNGLVQVSGLLELAAKGDLPRGKCHKVGRQEKYLVDAQFIENWLTRPHSYLEI